MGLLVKQMLYAVLAFCFCFLGRREFIPMQLLPSRTKYRKLSLRGFGTKAEPGS
jgi:hypothetical protein